MPTGRYILRYRGEGPIPALDVERIRSLDGVKVVDSTPRMLLVEAPPDVLKQLVGSKPQWVLTEERMIPLPDTKRKIRQDPEEGE